MNVEAINTGSAKAVVKNGFNLSGVSSTTVQMPTASWYKTTAMIDNNAEIEAGGSILVNIAIPEARPQMVTVRPMVFDPLIPDSTRTGEIIREAVSVEDDEAYVILSTEEKSTEGAALAEAKVVVSGGRGIKKKEDLEQLRQLAELLGGQLGCSRPLCDNGWMPHDTQIGQSGVTVKPDFILNVGVLGAGQYTSGMDKSGCVMSINYTSALRFLP